VTSVARPQRGAGGLALGQLQIASVGRYVCVCVCVYVCVCVCVCVCECARASTRRA
jgi:hypothetical protein